MIILIQVVGENYINYKYLESAYDIHGSIIHVLVTVLEIIITLIST